MVAALSAPAHGTDLGVTDIGRIGIVKAKPDQKRPRPRQAAGRQVGAIAKASDHRLDPLTRIGPHIRLIIEDTRHGLDRDPSLLGHIVNCNRRNGRGPSSQDQGVLIWPKA